jgi:hypothetical protein
VEQQRVAGKQGEVGEEGLIGMRSHQTDLQELLLVAQAELGKQKRQIHRMQLKGLLETSLQINHSFAPDCW